MEALASSLPTKQTMNPSSGDDLYVSGFNREHRDDAVSIARSLTSMSIASCDQSILNTKSESSGSPNAASTAANVEGPVEVDFYRNPTILSRMIHYNKFSNAQKRCRDHPWEASVWVCAKRKANVAQQVSPIYGMFDRNKGTNTGSDIVRQDGGDRYSMRQLPIHIACTSLAFAHDPTTRSDLEQLIVRLVVTYPEGCAEFDHGGKLPLHEAIWSNASPETVAMLLMAAPQSIENRDKFDRTPMELNNRRTGKSKSEIRDMLNLGVHYWDQARQEAKLRMKRAVPPPTSDGKSIDSQSVLGTSQTGKETIYTTSTVILPDRPQPHPAKIEPEEIVPMAWEMLERRVLLLEHLLAEMYEKNFELAGLVEELKKSKHTLRVELEASRASSRIHHSIKADKSKSPRSSLASLPSVAVVPEDDEVSSLKLMEQAERIEQLESLVDSYHSSKRKRRASNSGSKISELSSVSSFHTNDDGFIRDRTGVARQDSLVSGLTFSEASFFDASNHAVKEAFRSPTSDDEDTTIDDDDNESRHDIDIYHKPSEMHGSSNTFSCEPMPRKDWSSPISSASFIPAGDTQADVPSPMSVEEEDDIISGGSASSRGRQQPRATTQASEIYFPGFRLDQASANSALSLSTRSVATSAAASDAMSENSTIVSDDNEIYFAVGRSSLGSFDGSEEEEEEEGISGSTKSTRARLEDMVFGDGPGILDEVDGSDHSAQRYNYDIKIPALDTFHFPDGSGEI